MKAKDPAAVIHDESLAFLSKHLFKEPRVRHDIIHRKVLNQSTQVTVVKTTWNSFCHPAARCLAIEPVLREVNKAIAEAYMLANLHIARLCEHRLTVPDLNQTFFYQCLAAVSSCGHRKPEPKSMEFRATLELYRSCYPKDYCLPDATHLASGWFQQASQQMTTAAKNSTSMNFYRRFKRYLKLRYNLDGRTAYETLKAIQAAEEYQGTDAIVLRYRQLLPSKPKLGRAEDYPELVMPLQHRFLAFFRQFHGGKDVPKAARLFSLLPNKQGFACSHLKMCTNGFYGLLKRSGVSGMPKEGPVFRQAADLYWRRFFRIADFETANRKFAGEVVLDGKGVSIVLRKPKPKRTSFASSEHMMMSKAERWGLDPGRRDLFVASNQQQHIQRCSTRHFYQEAGYRYSARKIKTWQNGDAEIAESIHNMPLRKTASVEELQTSIRFVLPRLDGLIRFHMSKGFRDLKFKRYVLAQRKLQQICRQLTAKSGKQTIVGFGDWSNKDDAGIIKKSPAGPVKRLERLMHNYCKVVSVDEFRSSKLHEACHCQLEPAFIHKHNKRGKPEFCKRVKVHSVLFCRNKSCHGMTVNRDVNASRNILRLLEAGPDRPQAFQRCLPSCTFHGGCRVAGGATPPLLPVMIC